MTDGSSESLDQDQVSSGILANLPIILWQRRLLVIIPTAVIAVAAIAAAFLLPRTYVSRAVMLVETQSLPDGSVKNAQPVDVIDRRMAKIRQQILSRPDLVELIQTNNLYNASNHSEPLSTLVDRVRDATQITAVDADIEGTSTNNKWNKQDSIAFALTFEYPRAAVAQLVAQTFVNRLLALDSSEAQAQAQDNVRFLEDQQSDLQKQVDQIEGQITEITGRNGAALANNGMGMITIGGGDYDSQIASLRRDNAQLQAQLGASGVGRDPQVVAAEAALAAARAKYSDTHPDVILAQNQLAAAKANASQFQTNTVGSTIQKQIAMNNQTIAELSAARAAAQGRAAAMAAAQARGPVVQQQVAQLQAKADQVRTDLARVTTNLLNARSVSKITEEQRGERLRLIDPPVTPDVPTKPNRPMLILGGLFGGLAVGIALALAMEFIQRPIRSVGTLTKIVGAPPLVVIPVISTKKPRLRRKGAKDHDKEATT